MEEENLGSCESTTTAKPVLTKSEHSLQPGMAEKEPNPEEQLKRNPLATIACSPQITSTSQHGDGDALDADLKSSGMANSSEKGSLCDQFEIAPSTSKRQSLGNLLPSSCLSVASSGALPPPPMPGLIPLQHTQPFISSRFSPPPSSSSSSPPPSSTQFALLPGNLPDLVQVSSDSGSVDSQPHGNAGRCREYRKKRKRVLSECERDLAKMVAANAKLKKVADRLEHRVGKLKAFYIDSVILSKYKCLNSLEK